MGHMTRNRWHRLKAHKSSANREQVSELDHGSDLNAQSLTPKLIRAPAFFFLSCCLLLSSFGSCRHVTASENGFPV